MTIEPGYHALIAMSDYLADPCPEPSLSTSTADALIRRSALHAWAEHPRLGKKRNEDTSRGDIGSAAHALAFGGKPVQYVEQVTMRGGPQRGEVVVPKDWTTKDAQLAQAEIRAAGGIPLLPHQREQVEGVAESARQALATLPATNVLHEVTMLWQMEGVWARGRVDYLDDAHDIDLKTVDNADPFDFMKSVPRKIVTQKALRSLGHKSLGQPRRLAWLLVELEFPHAWSFVGLGPSALAQAEARVTWAAKRWRRCLDAKSFPGFRQDIYWAEAKPWEEMEFADRMDAAE